MCTFFKAISARIDVHILACVCVQNMNMNKLSVCMCVCFWSHGLARHAESHVIQAGHYDVGIIYQGSKHITLTTLQQSSTDKHGNHNH